MKIIKKVIVHFPSETVVFATEKRKSDAFVKAKEIRLNTHEGNVSVNITLEDGQQQLVHGAPLQVFYVDLNDDEEY